MPDNKISSTSVTDLTTKNSDTAFEVDAQTTDAQGEGKEFKWENGNWTQWFAYYNEIPELNSVINSKETWTVGKGFKADPETTVILNHAAGWGKDTFNSILGNLIRDFHIGGDAFAEIVLDDDGDLLNLKPLDPGAIAIIVNGKGIIKRYEQNSKTQGKKPHIIMPDKMFHLARNRVADQVHGTSITQPLVRIILMKNEAMADNQVAIHLNVIPRWKFKLKTDIPSEIAAYKAKMDSVTGVSANVYEPFDVSESELIAVAPNSTLNPISWIEMLDAKFYEEAQVPKIIAGGTGGFTEQAVTVTYLAFQQIIEKEQLFIEENVLNQLGYVINLEFPASVENNLLSDKKKDGGENIDSSETTAGQSAEPEEKQ